MIIPTIILIEFLGGPDKCIILADSNERCEYLLPSLEDKQFAAFVRFRAEVQPKYNHLTQQLWKLDYERRRGNILAVAVLLQNIHILLRLFWEAEGWWFIC